MTVTKTLTDVKLQLQLETETTKNGKAVLKNLSLNKLNPSATKEQLFTAAEALAGLQTLALSGIRTIDTSELSSDE